MLPVPFLSAATVFSTKVMLSPPPPLHLHICVQPRQSKSGKTCTTPDMRVRWQWLDCWNNLFIISFIPPDSRLWFVRAIYLWAHLNVTTQPFVICAALSHPLFRLNNYWIFVCDPIIFAHSFYPEYYINSVQFYNLMWSHILSHPMDKYGYDASKSHNYLIENIPTETIFRLANTQRETTTE